MFSKFIKGDRDMLGKKSPAPPPPPQPLPLQVAPYVPIPSTYNPSYKKLPSIAGYTLKYDYKDIVIAGTQHRDISFVVLGDDLAFAPEPTNPHDAEAVAIFCKGRHIGYFPKSRLLQMYHRYKANGCPVCGFVRSFSVNGVEMALGYYEKK